MTAEFKNQLVKAPLQQQGGGGGGGEERERTPSKGWDDYNPQSGHKKN